MDINNLISIIKKKISKNIVCEVLKVEDKSFLHKWNPMNPAHPVINIFSI